MRAWMEKARKAKNLTMKEAGERLGISESYYSMIERGERKQNLDVSLAKKISNTFDVPLDYIIEQEI